MTSQADLLCNAEWVTLMAVLFAERSGISVMNAASIDRSMLHILRKNGWVNEDNKLLDMELGYICYEFYRQNHAKDYFDNLLKHEAASRSFILDIGCGAGATLLSLARSCKPKQLQGIDLMDERIQLLQQLIDRGAFGQSSVAAQSGDAHSLPFENDAFELVYSRAAMQYFKVESALSEMFRVLQPGGKLFLHVHGSGYPLHYLIRRGGWRRMKNLLFLWHKLRKSKDQPSPFYTAQSRFLRIPALIQSLASSRFKSIHVHTDPSWMFCRTLPVYYVVTAEKPLV